MKEKYPVTGLKEKCKLVQQAEQQTGIKMFSKFNNKLTENS